MVTAIINTTGKAARFGVAARRVPVALAMTASSSHSSSHSYHRSYHSDDALARDVFGTPTS